MTPQVSSRDALSSSEIDDETWFGFLTSHLRLPSEVQLELLHSNSGRVSLGSRQWGPNCTNETICTNNLAYEDRKNYRGVRYVPYVLAFATALGVAWGYW